MKLTPEDIAESVAELEDLLATGETIVENFEMGTYTNLIKGQRDKDL